MRIVQQVFDQITFPVLSLKHERITDLPPDLQVKVVEQPHGSRAFRCFDLFELCVNRFLTVLQCTSQTLR